MSILISEYHDSARFATMRGFCADRGGGITATPATYFSAASEETIFSAAVHIRS